VLAASGGAGRRRALPDEITQVFHCPACGSTWAQSVPANASPPINDTNLYMQIPSRRVLNISPTARGLKAGEKYSAT
jgi:hypothetical protein